MDTTLSRPSRTVLALRSRTLSEWVVRAEALLDPIVRSAEGELPGIALDLSERLL